MVLTHVTNPFQMPSYYCLLMFIFPFLLADDDSDNCPHDFEGGGSDLEYGLADLNGLNLNSYSGGMQSQIQV